MNWQWQKDNKNKKELKKSKLWDILYLIGLIIVILGVSTMGYKGCVSGSKSSDYKIICIQGHEYVRSNFMQKMGLAIKLDKEGRPIPCS